MLCKIENGELIIRFSGSMSTKAFETKTLISHICDYRIEGTHASFYSEKEHLILTAEYDQSGGSLIFYGYSITELTCGADFARNVARKIMGIKHVKEKPKKKHS